MLLSASNRTLSSKWFQKWDVLSHRKSSLKVRKFLLSWLIFVLIFFCGKRWWRLFQMSHSHTPSSRVLKQSCVVLQELQYPPQYSPRSPFDAPSQSCVTCQYLHQALKREQGCSGFFTVIGTIFTHKPWSHGKAHGFRGEGRARNKGEEQLPHKEEKSYL